MNIEQGRFDRTWQGAPIAVGTTSDGSGPRALLLPALSSISTRSEMADLQSEIAEHYATTAVDWPGFGAGAKPKVAWTPDAMDAFLDKLLTDVAPRLVVAAGHSAGYLVRAMARLEDQKTQCALVAPTWRGPLPTMMGKRLGWLGGVVQAIDAPLVGPLLYRLNLSDFVIGRMARGHVYSNPAWMTDARLAEKRAVARAPGARFASARFVTGALDPSREVEDVHAATALIDRERLLFVWGAETPRKSKAAMEAWAAASDAEPVVLPRGKLSVHEEFPREVAQAILSRWPAKQTQGIDHDE